MTTTTLLNALRNAESILATAIAEDWDSEMVYAAALDVDRAGCALNAAEESATKRRFAKRFN